METGHATEWYALTGEFWWRFDLICNWNLYFWRWWFTTDHTPPVCHRQLLCNACVTYYMYVNVFIHSLFCLFAVLVILKVRVQLYRPINYWLCVVCVNLGSSWVIDHCRSTEMELVFQRTSKWTFGRLRRFVSCVFVCCVSVADVPRVYTNWNICICCFLAFGINCHNCTHTD